MSRCIIEVEEKEEKQIIQSREDEVVKKITRRTKK
jgi:hypothetical protein